jgi:YHS domain-containing protein
VIRFLLLLILFIVVARVFWKVIDAMMEAARSPDGGRAKPAVKLVRDPVCGTFVQPRTALSATAGGHTHYFCSEECRSKYTHA